MKDSLEIFARELQKFGMNIQPFEIIGKKVCITGIENRDDYKHCEKISIITTIHTVSTRETTRSENIIPAEWTSPVFLHFTNGGKIWLTEYKKGLLRYSNSDHSHHKRKYYNVKVHFMD